MSIVIPCSRSAIKAIGDQGQVHLAAASTAARPIAQILEDIGVDQIEIVQQAADQRALAVVDAARRHHPPGSVQARRIRNSPSSLRISIAASDVRSSSRVAPRSLIAGDERLGDDLLDRGRACDATGQVQVMSPTVR